jgi:DNA-binding LytR/AlgR family response regulator
VNTKKIQILLVEDEFIIADYIKECLHNLGYEVVAICTNYDDAITALKNINPDIAIIDISIKGSRNGIDIGNYISQYIKIPFVFASSHNDKATIDKAKQTQPYAYLIKPFTEEDLYAVIETALVQFGKQQQTIAEEDKPIIINDGIFVRHKSKFTKVILADIVYIESNDNYVTIFTTVAQYVLKNSLLHLINALPSYFLRTHKSYIVNLLRLKNFDTEELTVDTKTLPIGKSYYDAFIEKMKVVKG